MEGSTEQSKRQINCLEEVIRESGLRLGYRELKHEQTKAILSFVQGNDTFVALNRLRETFPRNSSGFFLLPYYLLTVYHKHT